MASGWEDPLVPPRCSCSDARTERQEVAAVAPSNLYVFLMLTDPLNLVLTPAVNLLGKGKQ
jgi:hypothetical protein